MSNRDPKGYYSILDVPPDASAAEIKRGFRFRAKDLHPDRNPSRHGMHEDFCPSLVLDLAQSRHDGLEVERSAPGELLQLLFLG